MTPESRTEQALMLISNALSIHEVNEIIEYYRNDVRVEADRIYDAGAKRIDELS